MTIRAAILAALLAATGAGAEPAQWAFHDLWGAIGSTAATFPTDNLAIRFCATNLSETAALASFTSCDGGTVATNLGTAPIVTNAVDGIKVIRRSGATPWVMAWSPGIAMSTSMTFYVVCTRASGELSVGFGRTAATAAPYSLFFYSDNNFNLNGSYYGVTQIVGRVLMIGHIEGTNKTVDVNGWQPAGQSHTYAAGTIDQIGRIGSSVYHQNEWIDGGIYTQKMSSADVLRLKTYCYENYGTKAP